MTASHQAPDTLTPADTWRRRAACVGLGDQMFPDSDVAMIERARSICRPCPVTEPCLQQALDAEGGLGPKSRHGVYAGFTGPQRKRLHDRGLTAAEAVAPKRPVAAGSLREAFDRHTIAVDDGHLVWVGSSPVKYRGVRYSPNQLGFVLTHGRDPVGPVFRDCDVDGCAAGAHLSDRLMREARKQHTATA